MDMETKKTIGNKIGAYFKEHWGHVLLSLLLAIFVWGLVLAYQNPSRVKTISGVSASFEGEADLIARKLVLVGVRSEILPEISVSVNTDLMNYSDIGKNNITATVSLRGVVGEGTYELIVTATSTTGEVVSVSPRKVTVTVDRLSTKKVPVEITEVGEQAENYWYSEPETSKDEIEISGAYSVISGIVSAKATVNITGKTESFSNSCTLALCDSEDNVTLPSMLYGEVPSVTVSFEIYMKKSVPLALAESLICVSTIPSNYEIYALLTVPANVTIICKDASIDFAAIESLALNSWDISGKTKNLTKELEIIVPDGIEILGDITSVTAYVNIREKIITKTFANVPVVPTNQESKLRYTLALSHVKVTVTGSISIVSKLKVSDMTVQADVGGLIVGESSYNVALALALADSDTLDKITYTLDTEYVSVVISER